MPVTVRYGAVGQRTPISLDAVLLGSQAKSRALQLVARIARRPLLTGGRSEDLRVVREVRGLNVDQIRQVIKCGRTVLDMVHCSIFLSNL